MRSKCGNYILLYNGEVYNFRQLRNELHLECRSDSDSEVVLEGFAAIGPKIVEKLEGMFAFVIYDIALNEWFSARDRLGIKPLFMCESSRATLIASEAATIARLLEAPFDEESFAEWEMVRRPVPGFTFFSGVREHLPGTWRKSVEPSAQSYWVLRASHGQFDQAEFENLLTQSVESHDYSDVQNVAFLSGGLDSAVIAALSNVQRCYCVGLDTNNEIAAARETAAELNKELCSLVVTKEELVEAWVELTKMRGEPLSVPNEGLIYLACKRMEPGEKVILSGEGADEILFGYDRIFSWALDGIWRGAEDFLLRYGYHTPTNTPRRLVDYLETERLDKELHEFAEDFFLKVHLGCLLRRLDFASMAASKEARVPFLDRKIVEYVFRKPPSIKLSEGISKRPLRVFASKLGLTSALTRNKVGFSAAAFAGGPRFEEYQHFRSTVLGALEW